MQGQLFKEDDWVKDVNPNDIVYTPTILAKFIIDEFNPTGKILEPCKGGGAFMDWLPENTEWCEIQEGVDFYKYTEKVDWIISNPPYSDWDKWLKHSFDIADNVVYLVPFAKVFKSMGTIKQIMGYGGIVKVFILPASRAGFPFGFPCGAFHFKRDYKGSTDMVLVS